MLTITFPEFCLFIKENSKVCYTFTLYLLNSDRWAAGALKAQTKNNSCHNLFAPYLAVAKRNEASYLISKLAEPINHTVKFLKGCIPVSKPHGLLLY